MNPLKSKFLFLIVLLCLITSSVAYAVTAPISVNTDNPEITKQSLEEHLQRKLSFTEKVAFKLFNKKIKKAARKSTKRRSSNLEDCGKIVLNSGEVLEVILVEVSDATVKYKRCGKPNDPDFVVDKKEIFSIQDSEGQVLFTSKDKSVEETPINKKQDNKRENKSPQVYQKTNGLAVASLVLGILSLLISFSVFGLVCGILGVIFGVIAKKQIRENPDKFRGRKMAGAGLVCGIIACALYALTISALISIF